MASVRLFQGFAGSSIDGRPEGTRRQEAAICPSKDEPLGNPAFDQEPAFVDGPVVSPAKEQQIIRICLPSFGPVLDMVGLQVTGSRASWKLAGSIPADQRPPERRRNLPCLAADMQELNHSLGLVRPLFR